MHRPPAHLLTRPVRVLVVGCGGTGSGIAGGLPYLHQAMVAKGHPHGLEVTLQDGDTISPTNCVRQPFCQSEIGLHKAEVLATRMNLFWGLRWKARRYHLTAADAFTRAWDLVIGCVDSIEARALIAKLATDRNADVTYWLDLGNLAEEGQYLLGQPKNAINPGQPGRLPTAAERWPEIVDVKRRAPDLPSCSAAEALTRQAPFVNQVLANHALSMLGKLFAGGIPYHGGFVNLATGKVSSIPVPEQPMPQPPEKKPGARARRRNRRQAGAPA
jgi:PRTRC genetic system ThiF family protein